MNRVQHVLRHPAGKIGLAVGLLIGFVAALMGETRKALFLAGLCQFLASRIGNK